MSSAIGALASLASTPGVSTQSVNQQTAAKDLAQLILDISAGDTTAAQKDLATLTKDLGSSATSNTNSPLGKLLTALGKDLGSGDIGAAQKDVESFLTSLESSAASGGHHRHHAVSDTADLSSTSTAGSSDNETLSSYLATLLQNLQAGSGSSSPASTSSSVGTT